MIASSVSSKVPADIKAMKEGERPSARAPEIVRRPKAKGKTRRDREKHTWTRNYEKED